MVWKRTSSRKFVSSIPHNPFWDVVVHYLGPGQSFTPWTYAIACISFDWLVAIYIVIFYGFGLVGERTPRQARPAVR